MSNYNSNSTLAGMYITTVNGLLICVLTLMYVFLTFSLVEQSRKSVKKSEEAIAQTKKEQQIRDIENRLEKFYIPAKAIINGPLRTKSYEIICGKPSENFDGLASIRKYSYLAKKKTYKAYEDFLTKDCRDFKLNTCNDLYRDIYSYECPHRDEACMYNWFYCEENFKYCEYYDTCPTENEYGIVLNKTYCKYYIELKNKITEDIEYYSKRLDELKE